MLPGVAHHVSQSQSLPGIHQLLHIAQIQFPVPCGEGGLPEPLDIQPLLTVSVSAVVLPGLAVAGQVNNYREKAIKISNLYAIHILF